MKAGAPWSIKGIDPESRELAKERARAAGMTLGQWLNKTIADVDKPQEPAVSTASSSAGALDTARIMRAIAELARRVDLNAGQTAGDTGPLTEAIAAIGTRLEAVAEAIPSQPLDQNRLERGLLAIARRIEALENRPIAESAIDGLREELSVRHDDATALSEIGTRLASLEERLGEMPDAQPQSADLRKLMNGMVNLASKIDRIDSSLADRIAPIEGRLEALPSETAAAIPVPAQLELLPELARTVETLADRLGSLEARFEAALDETPPAEPHVQVAPTPEPADEPDDPPVVVTPSSEAPVYAALNDLSPQDDERTAPLDEVEEDTFFREIDSADAGPDAAEEPEPGPASLSTSLPPPPVDPVTGTVPEGSDIPDEAQPPDRPRRLVAVESLLSDGPIENPTPERGPDETANTDGGQRPFRLDEPLDLSRQPPAPQPRRSKGWLGYAIVALILAGLLAGGFWFAGTPQFQDVKQQAGKVLDGLMASAGLKEPADATEAGEVPAAGVAAASVESESGSASTASTPDETSDADRAPAVTEPAAEQPSDSAAAEPAADQPTPPPPATVERPSALESLTATAESGDADAQYELGVSYRDGIGVEPNYSTAADWFDRAAQQGHVPAQLGLGIMYRQGLGRPKDLDLAKLWLHAAARAGQPDAQKYLGEVYVDESAGAPDYFQAARWFREAADQGVVDAQYNMGVLYEGGLGVPRDFEQSYYWFLLALRAGDTAAAPDVERVAALLTPEQRAAQETRVDEFNPATSPVSAAGPAGSADGAERLTRRDEIKQLQRLLISRGYDPGTPDGLPGAQTREAIRRWQADSGQTATGGITRDVLDRLKADG